MPSGVSFTRKSPEFLKHGDVVETGITGVGIISNLICAETSSSANGILFNECLCLRFTTAWRHLSFFVSVGFTTATTPFIADTMLLRRKLLRWIRRHPLPIDLALRGIEVIVFRCRAVKPVMRRERKHCHRELIEAGWA